MRFGSENANSSRGFGKILENFECLGLHFTRFDGGEREKLNIE